VQDVGTASRYNPVTPVRVLDTRDGTGTGGSTAPVGPQGTITLDLSAQVPTTTTAVVLNVTGTGTTTATHVTVFPDGADRPIASTLNLVPGQTRPNAVTVQLGAGRKVNLFNNAGSVHLIADLAGYYGPSAVVDHVVHHNKPAYRAFAAVKTAISLIAVLTATPRTG
jgi:hypothetical protein